VFLYMSDIVLIFLFIFKLLSTLNLLLI